MHKFNSLSVCLTLIFLLIGCGEDKNLPKKGEDPLKDVVIDFLQAIEAKDEALAKSLLHEYPRSRFKIEKAPKFDLSTLKEVDIDKRLVGENQKVFSCVAEGKEIDFTAQFYKSQTQIVHFQPSSMRIAKEKQLNDKFYQRHTINNHLKKIFNTLLEQSMASKSYAFKGTYDHDYMTCLRNEDHQIYIDNKPSYTVPDELSFLPSFKGKHPYNGRFLISTRYLDGKPKKKLDQEARIALDFYPLKEGDGKVSILFGNGQIIVTDVFENDFTYEKALEMLNERGNPKNF